MTKKVLNAAVLFTLAFSTTTLPRVAVVSAQQLASNAPHTRARTAAPARRFLKRMALSVGEAAEGSRVRVTSDAPIEGYQTYGEGGKFILLIPEADATTLPTAGLAGRGFARVEAEQRGDDALISFTTAEGFAPRVRASFNRLEILFASQQASGNTSASTSNSPTPTPTPPATTTTTPAGTSTDGAAANPASATAAAKPAAAAPGTSAARFAALLTPEKANPVQLKRFDKSPVIDGKLDEDVWKTAAVFKDFIQWRPGDLIAPSQPTEAYLGYDSKFIYVAFRAHDEPGKVRATVGKRDAIFDDDWVGVWLDTFNDGRRSYELIFNPLGIQADAIFTEGVSEDFSVDIVMESKGAVTNDGFIVEVAIPFKSLRYEAGKGKLWGVHFLRTIKRFNNEQSSWMPISRDNSSLLGQRGHITGLEGISTERTLEIIPSLTVSQEGRRVRNTTPTGIPGRERFDPANPDRFQNNSFEFDPGVSAKFTVTPQITLDFTYNPDFAQVEADATVVTANQRFPIFFEEKRPFFLEGKEIFETIISAVHTRTIVDPDYAVKLTGKQGRNTFGLMFASDDAPGNLDDGDRKFLRDTEDLSGVTDPDLRSSLQAQRDDLLRVFEKNATVGVLRFKRDIGKEGHIGFLGTTRNFVDRYNSIAGFDTRYRLNKTTVFTAQVLGSVSHQPFFYADEAVRADRKEKGMVYAFNLNMNGRNWGYELAGVGRSRFFRADVGFNRRFNTNSPSLFVRYKSDDKPKAKIVNWRVFNFTTGNFDWNLRSQFFLNESQIQFQLQKQSYFGIGFEEGYERVFESEFGPSREGFALLNSRNEALAGLTVPPCLNFQNDPALDPAVRAELSRCTFFGGDNERSAFSKDIYVFAGTTPSKKYSLFMFSLYKWGQLDFDFGTGNPNFPRVSPAALEFGQGAPLDPGSGRQWTLEAGGSYQPTDALRLSLNYNKVRLTRNDTGLVAFDDNIYSLRGTYQFTRFWFARARADYTTLGANVRAQMLLGWTPNPGTTFYVGYNDDLNRNGLNPFTGQLEPGFRRNGRLFFVKMSYLFRRSFGN
ncbi:MAG TPA: DUF5916 domain-containing protein [Pyrinomonadaceae bacterium]|nr:DUF5916 domain-containing protein [Pyrinomonadaceae bacterium]